MLSIAVLPQERLGVTWWGGRRKQVNPGASHGWTLSQAGLAGEEEVGEVALAQER